jgi:hypothetical protein
MKTMNRLGIFVLATLGAAFASGCMAAVDGQADEVSDEGMAGESTQALTLTTCPSDVSAYRGQNGLTLSCPCSAAQAQSGTVIGTVTYMDTSSLCRAAVHAGKITTTGGNINISIQPIVFSYTGSTRYGVTSLSAGTPRNGFGGSFVFP